MASTRQILANRARSRSPNPLEGKRRSFLNATRHGLLSKIVVLPNENQDAFEKRIAKHEQRLGSSDGVVFGMIEEMAPAYWRMRRAWSIERSLFIETIGQCQTPDAPDSNPTAADNVVARLPRSEARLHPMYQRSLSNILLHALAPNPPTSPSLSPILQAALPPSHPVPSSTRYQTNLVPFPNTRASPAAPSGIPLAFVRRSTTRRSLF